MDLGLGNLISLKRHLLSPDLVVRNTWDQRITDIGLGVAAAFERHCNRLWKRTVDAQDIFTADRTHWIAERLPVESISAVESKDDELAGWVSLGSPNNALLNWNPRSGVIQFGAMQGNETTLMRITYTGGYWYDTAETDDTVQPPGSTALPGHVRAAWFLQCKKIWEVYDPLGLGLVKGGVQTPSIESALAGLELIPEVKRMLEPEKRYAIN